MRILAVNDDGWKAEGIKALVKEFAGNHEVWLAAPELEHSGTSHSTTFFHDMVVDRIDYPGTKGAWAVWGTPADCTFMAVTELMPKKPDVVIAGINNGCNMSLDCIYSGTIGAATEGLLLGLPSIAVSLDFNGPKHYETAARAAGQLLPKYMADPRRLEYCLSINVPDIAPEAVKGYRVTQFDPRRIYDRSFRREQQGTRTIYHTLSAGCLLKDEPGSLNQDAAAVAAGWISLTPLMTDWVDHEKQKQMADWEHIPYAR